MNGISHGRRKSVKSDDVGRPRKRTSDETVTLGFRVDPALVSALDTEAERQSAEQPPGKARVSRTDVIKMALYKWLAEQQQRRSGRSK